MKVFLSWSGDLSHKVACAFREWLPSVIQAVQPYVSSEDIDKGTRWSTDIAKELAESSYGLICVTRENLNAPWIHFESGALSKSIDKANVTPFLFEVKRSEVHGPLLQFQSCIFEKDDVLKLLRSINARLKEGEVLREDSLKKAFEVWWPHLESVLKALPSARVDSETTTKKGPKQPEILEELLELVRNQQRLITHPESLLPPDYLAWALDKVRPGTSRDDRQQRLIEKLHSDIISIERMTKEMCGDEPKFSELVSEVRKFHMNFHEIMDDRVRVRRRTSAAAKIA